MYNQYDFSVPETELDMAADEPRAEELSLRMCIGTPRNPPTARSATLITCWHDIFRPKYLQLPRNRCDVRTLM